MNQVLGHGFSALFTLERIVMADSVAEVSAIVARLTPEQSGQVIDVAREALIDRYGEARVADMMVTAQTLLGKAISEEGEEWQR